MTALVDRRFHDPPYSYRDANRWNELLGTKGVHVQSVSLPAVGTDLVDEANCVVAERRWIEDAGLLRMKFMFFGGVAT